VKVLVTGASGGVARGVVRTLSRHYELRLMDLTRCDELADHDWIEGSILDPAALRRAVDGVGAVVHLAAATSQRRPTTEAFFDVNVKGLYLLLEAAAGAGVKTFVHVSSTAHVIGNWHEGRSVTVDSPPTTRGRYSLTKALQEIVCEHVARNTSMRVVALRLWSPREAADLRRRARRGEDVYNPGLIDTEDFGRACRAAIEAEGLDDFEIFHCVSTDEARRRFDADRTERRLGWRADDDFADLAPDG
jgi:nucleoside-diphosphate-sugar epimerase